MGRSTRGNRSSTRRKGGLFTETLRTPNVYTLSTMHIVDSLLSPILTVVVNVTYPERTLPRDQL